MSCLGGRTLHSTHSKNEDNAFNYVGKIFPLRSIKLNVTHQNVKMIHLLVCMVVDISLSVYHKLLHILGMK